jgi:hypothetical protein
MDKKIGKSNGLYTRGHMGGLRSMSLLVGCFYSSPSKKGNKKKQPFFFLRKLAFFLFIFVFF